MLVLAPAAEDSTLSRQVLAQAGMGCHVCPSMDSLCREVLEGAGAVLLTEDVLVGADARELVDALARQPAWSDLPVLLLVDRGADSAVAVGAMELLGNVVVLERPVRVSTLVSTLGTALRARRRQYELRDRMAALAESEQRFARFMQHLPGLAWIKDSTGRYVYANDAAERAFSMPRSHLYGRTDDEIFPAETAAQFRANDQRALTAETGIQTVEMLEHDDGVVHHSLVHKFPIPGGDTQGALIGGMAIDITDWKRAEEAQALLAAVVESSEDAIISKTLDGVILSWNGGAERLLGHKPSEVIGQSILLIVPPDKHDEERSILGQLRRGEHIEHYETARVSRHGRRLDVSLSVSPVRDRTGRIIGASTVARDITAQKQAREALRESEQRFRTLADNAPVLIWVNGLDGCEFVNREYLQFIGRSLEHIEGMGWANFVHPDDVAGYVQAYRDALERRSPFQAVCRLRRADGKYRWVKSAGIPRFTSENVILGYVGCSLDVTDLKQYEEALEEADRRKNEFLATLAHELRNPLAPIRNSLHILRLAGRDEAASERVVEMMERQVKHLVRLVDDLLEVSRITRGKIELRKEPVELAAILRSAVETSRPLIEAARHQLAISLPSEPVLVDADPVRLAQVIANLLNNAAKYTDEGGQIWLTARCEEENVVVSVRDTGVGIAPEMLPRVFDMFTQVNQSLGRAQGGLGIGLTLVKSLVQLHGGSVEAASAGPGQGSEFVVRLPWLRPGRSTEQAGAGKQSPVPVLGLRRVLVVDDSRDAADSLATLLRFLGADAHVVYDGPAALEAFGRYEPAVVLLDIGMPGMDGHEVARRLRQEPKGRDVLLIALTGWGQEDDRRRSREAGFDHHLVKPVDLDALQSLLASLEKRGSKGPGPGEGEA